MKIKPDVTASGIVGVSANLDYFVPLSTRIYLALLAHLNRTAKSVHEGDKPLR